MKIHDFPQFLVYPLEFQRILLYPLQGVTIFFLGKLHGRIKTKSLLTGTVVKLLINFVFIIFLIFNIGEGCLDLDQLTAVCEQVLHDNEASLVAAQAERLEL